MCRKDSLYLSFRGASLQGAPVRQYEFTRHIDAMDRVRSGGGSIYIFAKAGFAGSGELIGKGCERWWRRRRRGWQPRVFRRRRRGWRTRWLRRGHSLGTPAHCHCLARVPVWGVLISFIRCTTCGMVLSRAVTSVQSCAARSAGMCARACTYVQLSHARIVTL